MNEDTLSNEMGDIVEMCEDEIQVPPNNEIEDASRINKRNREVDQEEEWIHIQNRKVRRREERKIVEICITSKEIIPKQFALAKLFKNQGISNICRVKYINPYKIIIEVNDEQSAEILTSCEHLISLGWRFQRPLEVGLSYGVIKHIELGLSEEELLKSITSSGEIVNVKRLKRRIEGEGGWTDSESVRVGFGGSSLPSHINIYEMQVKVEPYIFPVTQCSRCWRFGHTIKLCPSKKVFCPKCGGKHENCTVTTYKCINCTKNHMSLNRSCPAYLKERKIREIMAEFNVTYRKAITMYVPPQPSTYKEPNSTESTNFEARAFPSPAAGTSTQFNYTDAPIQKTLTYAQAASSCNRNDSSIKNYELSDPKEHVKKKKQKKKKVKRTIPESIAESSVDTEFQDSASDVSENYQNKKKSGTRGYVPFFILLKQLKNIFCDSSISLKEKIEKSVQMCVEWSITAIFQNITNLPFLQGILSNYG